MRDNPFFPAHDRESRLIANLIRAMRDAPAPIYTGTFGAHHGVPVYAPDFEAPGLLAQGLRILRAERDFYTVFGDPMGRLPAISAALAAYEASPRVQCEVQA